MPAVFTRNFQSTLLGTLLLLLYLRLGGYHPLWRCFPEVFDFVKQLILEVLTPHFLSFAGRIRFALGPVSLAVTRGIAVCFLFLRLLRCFTSAGSSTFRYDTAYWSVSGSPIRKSSDLCLHAAHRGVSPLVTSFISTSNLVIHCMA